MAMDLKRHPSLEPVAGRQSNVGDYPPPGRHAGSPPVSRPKRSYRALERRPPDSALRGNRARQLIMDKNPGRFWSGPLLFAVLLAAPAGGQAPPATGMTASWNCDQAAGPLLKDCSGNGNQATLHGAARPAGSARVLRFSGRQSVTVNKNLPPAGASFTWSAWIRPASSAPNQVLAAKADSTSQGPGHKGFFLFYDGAAHNL